MFEDYKHKAMSNIYSAVTQMNLSKVKSKPQLN